MRTVFERFSQLGVFILVAIIFVGVVGILLMRERTVPFLRDDARSVTEQLPLVRLEDSLVETEGLVVYRTLEPFRLRRPSFLVCHEWSSPGIAYVELDSQGRVGRGAVDSSTDNVLRSQIFSENGESTRVERVIHEYDEHHWSSPGVFFVSSSGESLIVRSLGDYLYVEVFDETLDFSKHPEVAVYVVVREDDLGALQRVERASAFVTLTTSYDGFAIFAYGFFVLLLVSACVIAFVHRMTLTGYARFVRSFFLRGHVDLDAQPPYLLLSLVFLSVLSGVGLGMFAGKWQPMQLVATSVKMPLMALGTLGVTWLGLVIAGRMFGFVQSSVALFRTWFGVLLFVFFCDVAFLPITVFFALVQTDHDIVFGVNILCWGMATLFGINRFHHILRSREPGNRFHVQYILLSLVLMGFVGLQLAWMLRPWVSRISYADEAIPFVRSQGQNVYIEIMKTFVR